MDRPPRCIVNRKNDFRTYHRVSACWFSAFVGCVTRWRRRGLHPLPTTRRDFRQQTPSKSRDSVTAHSTHAAWTSVIPKLVTSSSSNRHRSWRLKRAQGVGTIAPYERTPYERDRLTTHAQELAMLGSDVQGEGHEQCPTGRDRCEGGYIRVVQDVPGKHGFERRLRDDTEPMHGPQNPTAASTSATATYDTPRLLVPERSRKQRHDGSATCANYARRLSALMALGIPSQCAQGFLWPGIPCRTGLVWRTLYSAHGAFRANRSSVLHL